MPDAMSEPGDGGYDEAIADLRRAFDLIAGAPLQVDSSGRVLAKVALIATLYFRDGYRQDVRQSVLECVREYRDLFGEQLRWALLGEGRFVLSAHYTDAAIQAYLLDDRLGIVDSVATWSFDWHGGQAREASEYLLEALGSSRRECEQLGELSYVKLAIPLTSFVERPPLLPQMLLRWCRRLRPCHGYGGIGIILPPETAQLPLVERAVFACAQRHPGIEVDYPINHSLWLRDAIKGGNWITVLSDRWIDDLGGRATICETLGDGFQLADYSGGSMILAGTTPEIGDRNRNVDTPRYRRLAKVLKPIRLTVHPAIHGPAGGYDRAGFEQWLARFDD